jgi:hypothetical protein
LVKVNTVAMVRACLILTVIDKRVAVLAKVPAVTNTVVSPCSVLATPRIAEEFVAWFLALININLAVCSLEPGKARAGERQRIAAGASTVAKALVPRTRVDDAHCSGAGVCGVHA